MTVRAIVLLGSIVGGMFTIPTEAEAKCKRCGRDRCYDPACCAQTYCASVCAPCAAVVMDNSAVSRELIQLRLDHESLKAEHGKLKSEVELLKQPK
jgi:hypothetical protein